MNLLEAYRLTFGLYATVNLLAAGLYLFLSSAAEVAPGAASARDAAEAKRPARISPQSKAVVTKLAALSGIDSLGGGFLSDALIAYFEEIGNTEEAEQLRRDAQAESQSR